MYTTLRALATPVKNLLRTKQKDDHNAVSNVYLLHRMNLHVTRDARWLSLGFLLMFFGFDGVQQYVTIFFQDANATHVGFTSLVLIYAAFMLMNPLSPTVINRLGSKRSMLLTFGAYALYCIGLLSKTPALIYGLSLILGASAGILWTAQNSYLVRVSAAGQYGKHAGFFGTSFAIGAGLGVFTMGVLIPRVGTTIAFASFASIIALGGACFWKLRDVRGEAMPRGSMRKMLRSATAIRYSMLWLAFNFIQGLVLGIIPLKIADTMSIGAVGPLIALFYISPIAFSYVVGKRSDQTGRRGWTWLMLALGVIGLLVTMVAANSTLLIAGVIILALNFGISRTITFALVGDVTTKENTENFSALVWAVQAAATLGALLLSALVNGNALYAIALCIVVLSIIVVVPLLALPLESIRERITKETL